MVSIILFLIVLVAALVMLVCWISMIRGFSNTGVPFVGSRRADVADILKAAQLKDGQVFFDLGSGDGRVVFAAQKMANLKAVGFELAYGPYLFSRLWNAYTGSRARFVRQNFLNYPWQEADVIYCYLSTEVMVAVQKKFLAECRPGTILLSNAFLLPNGNTSEQFKTVLVKEINLSFGRNAYAYYR